VWERNDQSSSLYGALSELAVNDLVDEFRNVAIKSL
jgi:hypothetical protein